MEEFTKQESPDGAYSNPLDLNVRRMTQNRKNKKGLIKIEIEVRNYVYQGFKDYKLERTFINTNIWVNPKNWKNKGEKLSSNEPDCEVKRSKINAVYSEVYKFVSSQGRQEIDQTFTSDVDYSALRKLFPSRKENRKTFYDYFIEYMELRRTDGDTAENTIRTIKTVTNRIRNFDISRKKKTFIEEVNFVWSDGFNKWMVEDMKYEPPTIDRTYQIVGRCLKHWWKRRDNLQLNISEDFKDGEFKYGKKVPNKPISLTHEQREFVYEYRFDKNYLEKARKMFCIQCYTGCRYGDISRFTPENFTIDDRLIFTPKKTKRWDIFAKQPLHPKARELFKEVEFNTTKIYTTSNQKYDDYIQEMIDILREKEPNMNFPPKFTSHNCRDTFISIGIKRGVNFKSMLLWVGQKKYETLAVYIDLDDDFQREEMEKTI